MYLGNQGTALPVLHRERHLYTTQPRHAYRQLNTLKVHHGGVGGDGYLINMVAFYRGLRAGLTDQGVNHYVRFVRAPPSNGIRLISSFCARWIAAFTTIFALFKNLG